MGDPKAALFRVEEKEVEEKTERSKFLTMIPVILGKRNFLLLYTIHFHVNLPNKYVIPQSHKHIEATRNLNKDLHCFLLIL